MIKLGLAFALGIAVSGCAAQPGVPAADSGQPAATQAGTQTRRVCETIEDDATGTKISRRQECHDVVDDGSTQPKAH